MDGEHGVIIPDDLVTYIAFEEELSVMYEQEVGSCEDLCEGDMKSMQNSIYGSFWNESSGGVGGGLESLLDKAGDQEEQKPSVLCGSSGAAASSHEPQEKVVETPKKGQRTGTPKPVVATPKATPGAGLGSRLSPKTQGTCKSPPQGDDGAAGAKKRGRAPKDHEVFVRQEVQEFLKADATTSLWWGADAKTKLKDLTAKHKEITARISRCHCPDEDVKLNKCIKALSFMMALVEVVLRHGSGSTEFKRIYDLQDSRLRLPPIIEHLDFPNHLKSLRWQMDTADIGNVGIWLRRTSSSSLKSSGVADIQGEQMRLWSERMADLVRGNTLHRQRMREHFNTDIEYDVEESSFAFLL